MSTKPEKETGLPAQPRTKETAPRSEDRQGAESEDLSERRFQRARGDDD